MSLKTLQLVLFPILFPLSLVYGLLMRLRNFLFDKNVLKSVSFEPFVICVGNLNTGGTGKTPFVNYLIESLIADYTLATLSRGYKRSTKGFLLANNSTKTHEIGDEPMMYYARYGAQIGVAVGEDRVLAIPYIIQEIPETRLIIMDDAFQHRYVKPDLSILITDFSHLFVDDYMMPFGMLREPRDGASRADVIIVSKCPDDLNETTAQQIKLRIKQYAPHSRVFFTHISQQSAVGSDYANKPIIIFSGIAQNTQFYNQLVKTHQIVGSLAFNDHHWYTKSDIEQLKKLYEKHRHENPVIVTTEKDFVRLQSEELKDILEGLPLCFVPIKVRFLNDENSFLELLKHKISEK